MKNIKAIIVEPDKKPSIKMINNINYDLYGLVYYPYKKMKLAENIYLIYSKDATLKKELKRNRIINNVEIYSTFIIVGCDKNSISSLSVEQIENVKKILQKLWKYRERGKGKWKQDLMI